MLLAFVIVTLWAAAFTFLFRVPVCRERTAVGSPSRVSVIIPARNEALNLPTLLASIAEQNVQPHEVIVVDDGSTDPTATVARDAGARVLSSQPLPEGWRGKAWACMQGAEAATGDVLLFIDADTFFETGGIARIVGAFSDQGGALSLAPYHRVERPYEELSTFFNIMMVAGTAAFGLGGTRRSPAGLFGPVFMIERAAYHGFGGHAAVRDKILEHFHIARVLRKHGVPMRCLGGRGTIAVRMYPNGLRSLVAGWSKAFASGAIESPRWIVLASVAWFVGLFLAIHYPIAAIMARSMRGFVTGVGLYLLFTVQIWAFQRQLGSFRLLTALLYPVPLIFYQAVFAHSLFRQLCGRKVVWKDREIDTDATGKRG